MAMTPEERRQRMHKALGQDSELHSRRTRARKPAQGASRETGSTGGAGSVRREIKEESFRTDAPEAKSDAAYTNETVRSERSALRRAGGRTTGRKGSAEAAESSVSPAKVLLLIAAVAVIIALLFGIKNLAAGGGKNKPAEPETTAEPVASETQEETTPAETEPVRDYLGEAKLMFAQYDYDGAMELLKSMPDYESNTEAKDLVAKCEEIKPTLVEQDIHEITHVFFHILTVDPENSFDENRWGKQAGGYNSLMTTIDEFKKMMQEMYDKGFVLVSLHDLATFTDNADGTVTATKGSIMLPPGKKAFVMSEDDVCYYEYMVGAGYADKMIIGEDGRPTLHYTDKDGNEFVGDYDLLGVLDTFIDEHPDFSYHGHKACLVFTGYNGILGYRTDESYDPNSEYYDPDLEQGHDVEAERREAVEVLKAIIADGYDVGSHSWGHRDLGQIEYDRFKRDCDRWERNVAPLIREALGKQPDIIIYPKGADVADWHGYSHSNERFDYMHKLGFRYFCNVDSNQYWVQFGDDYLRQGRRALDGYNMWNDIANGYHRLSDLFDNVSDIFDPARPTPVPPY